MNIQQILTTVDTVIGARPVQMDKESVELFLRNFENSKPYSDWILEEFIDVIAYPNPLQILMGRYDLDIETAKRLFIAGEKLAKEAA